MASTYAPPSRWSARWHSTLPRPPPSFRSEAGRLDLIGGSRRVAIEELHCLTGILSKILVDEIEFVEELVRHRNDIATALLGMEDVQEFPRACPQQFRLGARAE